MKNTSKAWITAITAVLVLVLAACSGKKETSGGSGDSGSAPAASAAVSVGRTAPAADFSYDLTADGNGIKITGYTGKGGVLVIPATIEDMPVTEIGASAFRGASGNNTPNNKDAITSIVVPDSVVVIGDGAFGHIDELTKVVLPDAVKILLATFSNCKKMTSVNLPSSLEIICTSAFTGCGELTDLTIPASLTSVKFMTAATVDPSFWREDFDNYAFSGCGKLPIKTRQTIQGWGYTSGF